MVTQGIKAMVVLKEDVQFPPVIHSAGKIRESSAVRTHRRGFGRKFVSADLCNPLSFSGGYTSVQKKAGVSCSFVN